MGRCNKFGLNLRCSEERGGLGVCMYRVVSFVDFVVKYCGEVGLGFVLCGGLCRLCWVYIA